MCIESREPQTLGCLPLTIEVLEIIKYWLTETTLIALSKAWMIVVWWQIRRHD
jgi:hypothetical protein